MADAETPHEVVESEEISISTEIPVSITTDLPDAELVPEHTDVTPESIEVVPEPSQVVTEPTEVVAQSSELVPEPAELVLESTEVVSEPTEIPESKTSEEPGTEVLVEEVQDAEQFEEIEEEYEEELEENGEVKVVIKKRVVRIAKSPQLDSKEKAKVEEEEKEEEYEEEEVDENGEIKIVTKKRIVKVPKSTPSREGTESTFIEQEEEYEEEEVDEMGETRIVKKTRLVLVPKKAVSRQSLESYEEKEEEYEEEEVDENGESITVTKTRIVKVPKKKTKEPEEIQVITEEKQEVEDVSHEEVLEKLSEEAFEEGVEKEKELEDEEVEEEEVEEEEEEGEKGVEPEGALPDRQLKKVRRKKKVKKEKEGEEAEEKPKEETVEKVEEDEEISAKVSMSSAELRLAEERDAITQQFEILMKLQASLVVAKKKNFFLTNKLVQYFKKQKMDHVFTETKEDPAIEQQLHKKLLVFHESNQQMDEEKLNINTDWEAQRFVNEELAESVKQGWEELMTQKREVASKLMDSRTGRTVLHDKTIEDLVSRQEIQLKQISDCRLTQIKLRRRIEIKKDERQMDHMGGDFRLMDYEKLSSLKEYYMDKIKDRDIEIGEVKQKLANMEDNLSHVKEQLKQREEVMEQEQLRLQRVSYDLNRKRASLNKIKASRHKTEKNTAKIKQQSGLLAYPILVKDYEEKTGQLKELMEQTDMLKETYKNGVIRIRKLRDIISKRSGLKPSLPSSSVCLL